MGKGTHFIGQPMFGQLISLIDKSKVLGFSREKGGERYVKHFDAWQHLVVMLYAVIKRFDSLREITDSMFPEARKLSHLGIGMMPRRSTLSDANARRPQDVFESTYRDLYATYKGELSSDSRKRQVPKWQGRLQIIDSTTITLFSNLLFKGVGRHPKTGRKKGGIKVHANIHANAIKIQIWVTLIANLLLMVIQKRIKRTWSFSGLATMFRIMLMYYVNCYTFFEEPEKDWLAILKTTDPSPPEPTLFD